MFSFLPCSASPVAIAPSATAQNSMTPWKLTLTLEDGSDATLQVGKLPNASLTGAPKALVFSEDGGGKPPAVLQPTSASRKRARVSTKMPSILTKKRCTASSGRKKSPPKCSMEGVTSPIFRLGQNIGSKEMAGVKLRS
jgi:hypothetical protein